MKSPRSSGRPFITRRRVHLAHGSCPHKLEDLVAGTWVNVDSCGERDLRGLLERGMAVGCVRAACAAFWGACCPLGQPRPRAPSQQELLEVPASPGATGSQAAVVSPLDTPSVLIASPHDRSSRWCGGHGPSLCSWLHIGHKAKVETRIDEQEFLMKGWLYRECHSTVEAASMLRLRLRRRWFVLTPHGLDYYREPAGASGKGRRLGGLVLTQLCTAEGPDEESQEAAGLWKVTLCGRRLCMRLFTRSHPEALTWHHALRSAIAALPPTLSPTQMLISDIQECGEDLEALECVYRRNPVLTCTTMLLRAPLLPLPYKLLRPPWLPPGQVTMLSEEALKVFCAIQSLDFFGSNEASDLVQRSTPGSCTFTDGILTSRGEALVLGVLKSCAIIPELQGEAFCQLVKQTCPSGGPFGRREDHEVSELRVALPIFDNPRLWFLLLCMCCVFEPGYSIFSYLELHLQRSCQRLPCASHAARYASRALAAVRRWPRPRYLPVTSRCLPSFPSSLPLVLSLPSPPLATPDEELLPSTPDDVDEEVAEMLSRVLTS